MENKNPILSICIPTYNGGNKLFDVMDILSSIVSEREDLEVIVSDNCSTDNTSEVLSKYKNIKGIYIYRNDVNLGLNGNLKLLIDKYAIGQYCWVIGDDDFVDIDAVDKLVDLLKKETPSFVSVKHRLLKYEDFKSLKIDRSRLLDIYRGNYFECLDQNASKGNILGTFMSSQIFLLEPIKAIDKTNFGINNWEDFKQTFPNSYMMTCAFHADENCCAIKTPIITALIHPKAWDNQLSNVFMNILPGYYFYCKRLAKDKNALQNTEKILTDSIIVQNIIELKNGRLRNLKWKYVFKLSFFKKIIALTKESINKPQLG